MVTIQCKNVSFENVQAVLFDKDGTLADSHAFLKNLGQRRARLIDAQIPGVQEPLLMAFGIESSGLNPAGLMAVGSRVENEIAAAAYIAETGRDWIEALSIARSAFAEADSVMQRKADSTPLFDGALELLQTLAKAGIKVGIISADTTENVVDFVERYGLGSIVKVAIGTDASPGKPDPALFYQACAELGTQPEVALSIGDSAADLKMTQAAGAIGFVGVTWGWTKPDLLEESHVLVQHFNEIQVWG